MFIVFLLICNFQTKFKIIVEMLNQKRLEYCLTIVGHTNATLVLSLNRWTHFHSITAIKGKCDDNNDNNDQNYCNIALNRI